MAQGYIDGVYNYCDRWCERCPLTARCRLFAMETELRRTDDENAAFWRVFGDIAQREPPPWVEEVLSAGDEPEEERFLPELDEWDDDEDDFLAIGEKDPAARMAQEYGLAVHRWLKQHTDLDKLLADKPHNPPASPEEVRREDLLEIISWYSLQIGVKLIRALSGAKDLEEEPFYRSGDEDESGGLAIEDGVDDIRDALREAATMERDGSAKVSLIGIERSLGAWTLLRDDYPEHEETIREFQTTLARLRRHIDQTIPGARTFQRPGFEYEV